MIKKRLGGIDIDYEGLIERIDEVWAELLATVNSCSSTTLGPAELLKFELTKLYSRIHYAKGSCSVSELEGCLSDCRHYVNRLRALQRLGTDPSE